jgi:hypothetical protein
MQKKIAIAVAAMLAIATAAEVKLQLSQIPVHILETAKAVLPGATFTAGQLDTDDIIEEGIGAGYEIQGTMGGRAIEVDVRPDGSVEEIEMVIQRSEVPAKVLAMFDKTFPGFQLVKVEKSTRPTRSGFSSIWYEFDGTTREGQAVDVEINEAANKYLVEPD